MNLFYIDGSNILIKEKKKKITQAEEHQPIKPQDCFVSYFTTLHRHLFLNRHKIEKGWE